MGIEMFDPYEQQFDKLEDPEYRPTDEKKTDEANKLQTLKQNENAEDNPDKSPEDAFEELEEAKNLEEHKALAMFGRSFKKLEGEIHGKEFANQIPGIQREYGPDGNKIENTSGDANEFTPDEESEGPNSNLA